ncbi:hypothetical protein BED46_036895 [Burkholderia contaminans]|uniref:Transposase n=1 Tax=Burkholderia contaminans LMG 23361 TaxID=1334628 RepID=A0ABD4ANY3_9BURK|nr:hypothetical protein WR31_25865 [Burkholderia contaminans LMG 23361]ODN28945.1 hypothetical protein BGI28_32760 [Burkholderia contaminans]OMI77084.1 hypothetical protein BED46_036895 [Burkholderia contaminans]
MRSRLRLADDCHQGQPLYVNTNFYDVRSKAGIERRRGIRRFPLALAQWHVEFFQQARDVVTADATSQLLYVKELSNAFIVHTVARQNHSQIFARVRGEQRQSATELSE